MRACPNENSRFARRFKPRARSLTFETVDYFIRFTLAPPDSGRIRVWLESCGARNLLPRRARSTTPALKMPCRDLC
jgi:hypothetical protein